MSHWPAGFAACKRKELRFEIPTFEELRSSTLISRSLLNPTGNGPRNFAECRIREGMLHGASKAWLGYGCPCYGYVTYASIILTCPCFTKCTSPALVTKNACSRTCLTSKSEINSLSHSYCLSKSFHWLLHSRTAFHYVEEPVWSVLRPSGQSNHPAENSKARNLILKLKDRQRGYSL